MVRSNRIGEVFEAVLLFHSGSPWDAPKQNRWAELSGGKECTAKVLCDMVRAAQAETMAVTRV